MTYYLCVKLKYVPYEIIGKSKTKIEEDNF